MSVMHFGQAIPTSDGKAHLTAICGRLNAPRQTTALTEVTCKVCLGSNGLEWAQRENARYFGRKDQA